MTQSERRGNRVHWGVAAEKYDITYPLAVRAGRVVGTVGACIGDADPELAGYLERLSETLDRQTLQWRDLGTTRRDPRRCFEASIDGRMVALAYEGDGGWWISDGPRRGPFPSLEAAQGEVTASVLHLDP